GGPATPPRPDGRAPAVPPRTSANQNRSGGKGKRRTGTFLAGAVGVLVVIAAAFYVTGGDDDKKANGTDRSPSPTVTTDANLPAGVKCSGDSCTGKDAEAMGCSGDLVTTAATATVGATTVEVRYSETCGAAWGRITQAAEGDKVEITAGKAKESDTITEAGDTVTYTAMVAVESESGAKACAVLASGEEGCTE
ncbi:YjfA family protein, partial [Streptomyces sp. 15-116A]|uniref:YjfA family protein n=1 Tax=Streptomyces sp. 15-116A TaxID=2259035 RepID=UPI0021B4C031